MRLLLGLALILLLSTSAAYAPDSRSVVRFEQIALDRDNPDRTTFGGLRLLGAWRLTSNNPFFGGISSMRVRGNAVLALTDAAYVLEFPFDGKRTEAVLRVRQLPGIYTVPEPDRDSESMVEDPVTGKMWVGFEFSNTIRRYSANLGAKEGWVAPPAMKHWPENQGPEAFVRLPDGRFLLFSEASPGPEESREALIFPGDPIRHGKRTTRFFYKPPRGFSPTDAVLLPDGRILLVNRHFSVFDGVAAIITIVDPRDIRKDRIVPSRIVATLKPPLRIDNMEALSVDQANGETNLWIASDDNFNPLQQTLLMKFALNDPPKR
ncbi:MAG: esterase-like activity of phytase family protein [Sphingomonadaceae bacterium]